ncbi:MAG: hypothetical protein HUU35_10725 [Armatimonadetes bacterium]|nr:hypothetical protein [Armatimonadota bacterium]
MDGLALRLERLGMRGDFAFGEQPEAAPLLASVTLARAAPWKQGDHLEVATDIHPDVSEGQVRFKSLTEGGAALLLEPGGRQAWLWVANLVRHWRLFELTVPAGIEVRGYKRGQELPPLAEPVATMPLNGAQSGVWRLEAAAPLDADQVLASLVAGQGRGEARRER